MVGHAIIVVVFSLICIHHSGIAEHVPPIITSLSVWITEQICMSHKLGASSLITSRCWLIKLFYFLSYSCCWQWRHHWCTWPQGLCVVFLQLGYPPCSSYHLTLSQMTVQFRGSVSMLFAHHTNLTHPDMTEKVFLTVCLNIQHKLWMFKSHSSLSFGLFHYVVCCIA